MGYGKINNYINNAINIASQLSRIWEPVAGDNKEKVVIDIIRGYLEGIADAISIEPVEVGSWSEDFCYIETSGGVYPCAIHPPYHGEIDIEFQRNDIMELRVSDVDKIDNKPSSNVLFIDMPMDPDDIPTIANIVKMYNPTALVFIDRYDALRRIVVMDKTYCAYRDAKILGYPVLHIPKYVGNRILVNGHYSKIRIVARADFIVSYGYNLIVDVHGGYDRTIYITAHHDHWLSGGSDNLMGVALTIALAKMLRDLAIHRNIRAIFFTAEEGFPPKLSSFYWLVGSRNYVLNHRDEILDELELLLNFDVVYKGSIGVSTSNTMLRNLLRNIVEKQIAIQHDNVVFDSYSFTLLGLPALTINTFTTALSDGIYHTSLDLVDRIDKRTVSDAIVLAHRLITMVSDKKFITENMLYNIENELILTVQNKYIPLEILSELYRIIKALSNCSQYLDINNIIRIINMVITKAYVDKDVMKKLGVREAVDYIYCKNNVIQLPINRVLETFDDVKICMEEYLHNLEILAYILFKYCYTV